MVEADTTRKASGRTTWRAVIRLAEPLYSDSGVGAHCPLLTNDLGAKDPSLLPVTVATTLVLLLSCSNANTSFPASETRRLRSVRLRSADKLRDLSIAVASAHTWSARELLRQPHLQASK
ncbi:hypothetical protein IG631_22445 [Alternaria alternata]|nr:hypothetical protein IG631_22445 [Alternaria alternata]